MNAREMLRQVIHRKYVNMATREIFQKLSAVRKDVIQHKYKSKICNEHTVLGISFLYEILFMELFLWNKVFCLKPQYKILYRSLY